jgi:hypothetical protein
MGDGHGDQLFRLHGQRAIGERLSLNALNAASGPGANFLRLAAIPGPDVGFIALSMALTPNAGSMTAPQPRRRMHTLSE